MKARMTEPKRARAPARWQLVTACVAVAVVAVLTLMPRPEPGSGSVLEGSELAAAPQFDRLLGRESQAVELQVRRNDQGVDVMELASANPSVRIYALN